MTPLPVSRACQRLTLAVILSSFAVFGAAHAESLTGADLVAALQHGGYVIVMRHASSPRVPPPAADTDRANINHERQLDESGRKTARDMGVALKALRIPIGEVWSSPTYRALETIRLAGLPQPKTAVELGDGGQSMQAVGGDQAGWLKAKAGHSAAVGTDTVIVTHFPNIVAAFGEAASGLADGEAMIFHPTAQGAPELVARARIEAWPELAVRQ